MPGRGGPGGALEEGAGGRGWPEARREEGTMEQEPGRAWQGGQTTTATAEQPRVGRRDGDAQEDVEMEDEGHGTSGRCSRRRRGRGSRGRWRA